MGAADGFLAELLTRQGWQVTALERDPAQAAKARGRCHEVIVADLDEAAPRLEGLFDAIVYGDVLEHLSDPLPVLVALNRSLAAGGRVIVSVPNVAHLWVRLSLLLGRWDYADRGILDRTHLRFFTRRSFVALPARRRARPWRSWSRRRCRCLWSSRRASTAACSTPCTALSARRRRGWKGGLAYQFVACAGRASRSERAMRAQPKVVVVMPAYNAGQHARMTYEELPQGRR